MKHSLAAALAFAGSIPAEPFVEYRLELSSDGWAIPSVERVEIDYRVE